MEVVFYMQISILVRLCITQRIDLRVTPLVQRKGYIIMYYW